MNDLPAAKQNNQPTTDNDQQQVTSPQLQVHSAQPIKPYDEGPVGQKPTQQVNSKQQAEISNQNVNLDQQTVGSSGGSKEQEPVGVRPIKVEQVADGTIEVSKELSEIGVKAHQERVEVSKEVQRMGVESVGPHEPVRVAQQVQLPLSDDQIVSGGNNVSASVTWLKEWCIRQLARVGIHLKRVKGKTVRERV